MIFSKFIFNSSNDFSATLHSESTYSLYENEYITIQTSYLFKIAKKIKLSIDGLIKNKHDLLYLFFSN